MDASHSNLEHYNAVQGDIGAFNRTAHNGQPCAVGFTEVADTLALVAWTFKDQLIMIRPHWRTKRGSSSAVVMGNLLAIEREEAALMFRGWSQGLPVEPRVDPDPVAALNVVLVTAPRNPSSGQTPGLSWEMRR